MFDRTDERFLAFREIAENTFVSLIEYSLSDGASLSEALDEAEYQVRSALLRGGLPEFDHGVLPATHRCTLAEFRSRFGTSSARRQKLIETFVRLHAIANGAAASRILVGGSFIDDIRNPDDIDTVILIDRVNLYSLHGKNLLTLFEKDSLRQDGIDLKLEASEAGWWGWYRLLGKLREPSPGYRGLVEVRL